ncbi:hypothetical protein EYF80_026431 [Liparis tanakae]|uniref:Uncharacterized protein n=1 Tax=Liparis tanakae TaxID=230148 RepID=A0A4Z2HBY1_9TELE|nr:hypothetical protein EYF80_026431 [Liparis tanakae]
MGLFQQKLCSHRRGRAGAASQRKSRPPPAIVTPNQNESSPNDDDGPTENVSEDENVGLLQAGPWLWRKTEKEGGEGGEGGREGGREGLESRGTLIQDILPLTTPLTSVPLLSAHDVIRSETARPGAPRSRTHQWEQSCRQSWSVLRSTESLS